MNRTQLSVLILMCFAWGFHFVVLKWAFADLPPLHYAAVRMLIVAAILVRFLKFPKTDAGALVLAGICLGGLNYALMFSGVNLATASASAVAVELYTPFAVLLSVVFLGERVGWRRSFGIGLALCGVLVIAMREQGDTAEAQALGVFLVSCGIFCEAVGAILVKKRSDYKPIELLAFFALVGAVFLCVTASVLDPGGWAVLAGGPLEKSVGGIAYSVIGGSIIGHTSYYWLIQRLPISTVAPSVLLATLIAVFFSVLLLGEPFTPAFIVGGLMTVGGVGVILMRQAQDDQSGKQSSASAGDAT
ncbi:MAG: DMT family transporter [Parvularculaceae bacterium]|nr:MAG: DMT family transporter [Parvularculaceae bacterium]